MSTHTENSQNTQKDLDNYLAPAARMQYNQQEGA